MGFSAETHPRDARAHSDRPHTAKAGEEGLDLGTTPALPDEWMGSPQPTPGIYKWQGTSGSLD